MYEDSAISEASTAEVVEELLRQLVDARFVLTDRDGSVTVPQALRAYMGGLERIACPP